MQTTVTIQGGRPILVVSRAPRFRAALVTSLDLERAVQSRAARRLAIHMGFLRPLSHHKTILERGQGRRGTNRIRGSYRWRPTVNGRSCRENSK